MQWWVRIGAGEHMCDAVVDEGKCKCFTVVDEGRGMWAHMDEGRGR